MAKRNKKDYVESLAEETEESAVWRRYIPSRRRSGVDTAVKTGLFEDENGRVLSRVEDILKRWQEDFHSRHSILNRPDPENTASIPKATHDVNINTEPPSIQEIKKAWRRP